MIKAVIFDYGGVVTNETDLELERIISNVLGFNLSAIMEKIKKPLSRFSRGDINEQEFWKELSNKAKTKLPRNIFNDFWILKYYKQVKIHKDVLNLVNKLKGKGYKVGLISNTIKPHVRYNKKMGRYKYFDPVILSCEVGFEKPQRWIYKLALKRLRLRPEECVFVDDRKENVRGASKVGIKAFLFKGAKQFKKDLLSCGVKL